MEGVPEDGRSELVRTSAQLLVLCMKGVPRELIGLSSMTLAI